MATNKPTLEDVELSEEQRLLEEEAASRHSNIVKDKESKVKPQEQKGEKDKKKRRSERSDENRIDQVQRDDGNHQDGRHDDHQDGGHDDTVRDTPLCCHNSTQNTERINNILRNTKRHRTVELSIKTIALSCLLISVSIVSFNYGREKMANESKKDMNLKIPTGHQSSNMMKRIVEMTRKSLHDTEREEVTEGQENVDDKTESEPDTKTNQDYQGHMEEDESDEIFFISEARDRKSTTSTTKKPRGVSFWPR